MVTGGNTAETRKSVELLSTDGTRLCSLPNLPVGRFHHTQSGLITCGGSPQTTSCVTFSAGHWKKTHTLGQHWHSHTAWASPRGVLLMGSHFSRTTTELLNDDGSTTAFFNLDNDR